MNRVIKFRGWDKGMWPDVFVSGDLWTDNICEDLWHSGPIMQFTGLADKNGKEIYEGDCDSVGNVVEFLNGCWCLNGDRPLYGFGFEVSGNIYENPELITTHPKELTS